MRILHISHGGLPDPRIEKTALTMKKDGHQVIFLGGAPIRYHDLGVFEETYSISLGNDLDVAINPVVKRRWLKKISELKPDVIHAHNVIVAHFLLDTEYPAIYDDHEYWSKQTYMYRERKLPRGLASYPLMNSIPRWENKLLRKYPVITVNENTATEHRKKASWVGVTHNVPMLRQVEGLVEVKPRKGNVYVGRDFDLPKFPPHRNMTGLRNYLEFDVITGLTHRKMLEKLMEYKVGLTPWKPHPLHPYADPNRNYEYLHAGLQVIVNNIIKQLFQSDPYIHAFESYEDIQLEIENLPIVESSIIMDYARKHYIWENQEDIIRKAYQIALQ